MTLQSRELLVSQTKTSQVGGKVTRTRLFNVFNDDGSSAVSVPDAITTVGIEVGDPHPDDPALFAIRYGDGQRREGHRDLVELRWFYENIPPIPPGQPRRDEVGYVDQSTDYRKEFVKLYRIQPGLVFPKNGQGNVIGDDLTLDIEGTPNDIRGHRRTALLYKSSYVITETIDHFPSAALYGFFSGKRNSTPFFGAPIGKVVFAGAKGRSIGISKWAITHQLFYDEWFHLLQISDRDQQGNIRIDCGQGDPPPGEQPLNNACRVFWRQPYPELADLHQLSDYFIP